MGGAVRRKKIIYAGLIILALALVALPLVNQKSSYKGTDDQVKGIVGELHADYKPWWSGMGISLGDDVVSMLFAVQAALGAGILGYGLGYMKGSQKKEKTSL
jgi:cobalt/nickel transport protein